MIWRALTLVSGLGMVVALAGCGQQRTTAAAKTPARHTFVRGADPDSGTIPLSGPTAAANSSNFGAGMGRQSAYGSR